MVPTTDTAKEWWWIHFVHVRNGLFTIGNFLLPVSIVIRHSKLRIGTNDKGKLMIIVIIIIIINIIIVLFRGIGHAWQWLLWLLLMIRRYLRVAYFFIPWHGFIAWLLWQCGMNEGMILLGICIAKGWW
jgi:hypothetical protein